MVASQEVVSLVVESHGDGVASHGVVSLVVGSHGDGVASLVVVTLVVASQEVVALPELRLVAVMAAGILVAVVVKLFLLTAKPTKNKTKRVH